MLLDHKLRALLQPSLIFTVDSALCGLDLLSSFFPCLQSPAKEIRIHQETHFLRRGGTSIHSESQYNSMTNPFRQIISFMSSCDVPRLGGLSGLGVAVGAFFGPVAQDAQDLDSKEQ